MSVDLFLNFASEADFKGKLTLFQVYGIYENIS